MGYADLYSILPAGTRYRELWLPELINSNASLPSSIAGHPLTLTGARKGSTADGVHFTGAVTSNINCGAIHDNAATLWISFRFKFDQPYATGSGDQYIWGKWLDATHLVWLVFKTADGKLYFEGQDGGVNDFSVAAQDGAADITSWSAGQWYHVLASISAANDVRFRIDNGTVVTFVTAIAAPNGGDFIIGDYHDPGAGTGFEGVIADFVCGTGDLTATEEAELYKGIPPAAAVEFYPLDEGRGTTAYNRGSAGAASDGTLDTSATWKFGQVQQPVLSLDGINDRAQSGAGVDISGDITLVWVGKMKSTYDTLTPLKYFAEIYIDGSNSIALFYHPTPNVIRWRTIGAGTVQNADYAFRPSIGDYLIMIGTLTLAGVSEFFINGSLVAPASGTGVVSGAVAIAYLGIDPALTPDRHDISKPLFIALIDGAFTQKQALAYSKIVNDILGLGLTM